MRNATSAQINYLRSLVNACEYPPLDYYSMSVAEASERINEFKERLEALGKSLRPARREVQVTDLGMYRTSDKEIYRVHQARGSGNLYAKHLLVGGGFEYEAGAIYKLAPSDKMTLEEAKAYGVETGQCCVCGAFLTDENSVAEGIGPVCKRSF